MNRELPKIEPTDLIDLNFDHDISRYIRKNLAQYLGLEKLGSEDIIFINGADAAIHAIALAFFQGKNVAYFDLNYRYTTSLIQQKSLTSKEWKTTWDLAEGRRSLQEVPEGTDVLYITNPDNRLGLLFSKDDLQNLIIEITRSGAICVIDESYMDFASEQSLCAYNLPNMIVIRTFSKFFSLEPSRIGYIVGDKKIIQNLRDYIPQYPIATDSIIKLVGAISVHKERWRKRREESTVAREKFYKFCRNNNVLFVNSNTNFVATSEDPKNIEGINLDCRNVKKFYVGKRKFFRLPVDNIEYR